MPSSMKAAIGVGSMCASRSCIPTALALCFDRAQLARQGGCRGGASASADPLETLRHAAGQALGIGDAPVRIARSAKLVGCFCSSIAACRMGNAWCSLPQRHCSPSVPDARVARPLVGSGHAVAARNTQACPVSYANWKGCHRDPMEHLQMLIEGP